VGKGREFVRTIDRVFVGFLATRRPIVEHLLHQKWPFFETFTLGGIEGAETSKKVVDQWAAIVFGLDGVTGPAFALGVETI
jgi:hypothetical protein